MSFNAFSDKANIGFIVEGYVARNLAHLTRVNNKHIVVLSLSNLICNHIREVSDDLKIHQTFSAYLTLKNTLGESVS
jgi:hypothetical protein